MDRPQGHVPTSIVLRYGAGQLGAQIFRDTPAVLLPIFMTTMLGVPAWLSGIVILIPKLWVIACDPLVGAYSDRLKPLRGRAPFLLIGAILTSIGFLSLFAVTDYGSPRLAAIAICALFFVASTAFSIYSVPYLAIASELSTDPHERTRILVYRMLFTTAGVLIGVGVAQPLVFALGGGAYGWRVMAVSLGVVCFISMMVPALTLRRLALLPGGAMPTGLLEQIKPVLANRPYMVLIAACFVQGIGQASSYTVLGFVFLYALDAIWLVPAFIIVMVIGSGLSQPVWLALSRRYGKEICYVVASLLWTAVTISWFWVHPGSDVLVTLPIIGPLATQHVLVLLRAVIIGPVNAGFLLLALSLLTDTVDYQRRRFGVAHEGVFSGIFSAAEKLAFAMGPLVAGIVLSLFGFTSSTGGAGAQSPHAITGILLLYSFVPATTQILSLLIFGRFRIDNWHGTAELPTEQRSDG
jgi:GPH family glycoside/pentoside/hexuronide:cation symporter